MKYLSTRDKSLRFSAAQAIKMGLSRDGGLFTPAEFPSLSQQEIRGLCAMTYQQRAACVMGKYLDDFTAEELSAYARNAYGPDKFDTPAVAPLRQRGGATQLRQRVGRSARRRGGSLRVGVVLPQP